jgi:mono/diheme cytochrome c family protein
VASLLAAAILAIVWAKGPSSAAFESQAQTPVSSLSYTAQVEPIFKSKCLTCHSSAAKQGGLILETYDTLLKGGKDGPVVIPGRSGECRLVLMLEGKIQPRMPFGADALPDSDIATIKAWIDAGASGPAPGEVSRQEGEKGQEPVSQFAPLPPSPVKAGTEAKDGRTTGKAIDFSREIRPILSDKCFACHGPDAQARQANLRLDTREGAFADRGGYRVIVPGNSAASKLYQKISARDQSVRMPPVTSGRTLTPAQVELIRRWIDQGAPWEVHWAYIPPRRPAVPNVKNQAWVRNPIDNFVLERLEREGLKPSPEADKTALLRRVTFDLTGLPPTLAELDAFLADHSPDAYEKRVEQLLQSPHYGEKMAMPWLDLARYADTHGYHIDSLRDMSHWRDWVIGAFNRNMPFDQFTIDQLAGDLLPAATLEQRTATGFNRNHMINFEGGAIPQEYHVEYVVDRVSTTATAWLGLTMGCARCHDHKYDPITQKDFYRFFAFFNTVAERGLDGQTGNAAPLLELPTPEEQRELDDLNRQIAQTLATLPEKDIVALENQWRQTRLASSAGFQPSSSPPGRQDGGATSMPAPPQEDLAAHYEFEGNLADSSGHGLDGKMTRGQVVYEDGAIRKGAEFSGETQVDFGNAGDFDRSEAFALAFWANPYGAKGMELLQKRDASPNWRGYEISLDDPIFTAVFTHEARVVIRLASRWPDDAIEVQSKQRVLSTKPFFLTSNHHLVLNYDGSGKAQGLRLYLDGKPVELATVKDQLTGSIRTSPPLQIGNKNIGRPLRGLVDDFRIYTRVLTPAEVDNLAVQLPARVLMADLAGKPVAEIESLKPGKPVEEADIGDTDKAETKEEKEAKLLKNHQARLSEYFLTQEAPEQYRQDYARLKDLRAKKEKLQQSVSTTMVMAEMKKPRDTFVLGRGQYDNPGEKVTPDTPAFLAPLPAGVPLNRLTLAKWLVDPANPLTSRVAVNRYWQSYFGTGIVKTAEDFGSQGEPPSHPELLDWLATEFIRTGWDVKGMQRLIVTSATYRQSSRATPELLEKDPENRLLARGPRFRLPAEIVRDNALAVSGLLNPEVGGPSVYPYQPKGLWEEMAYGEGFTGQTYTPSRGGELYRRSMYTLWKRTVPPPGMATFDAPDREKCTARRLPTNSPLQALELMNDPTYVEAARALAQRTLTEAGRDPDQRIRYAFRLATARNPAPRETQVLRQLARQELVHYRRDKDASAQLLKLGESSYSPKLDANELAAWTTVASTILNLDETITKE